MSQEISWAIFSSDGKPSREAVKLPPMPPWRDLAAIGAVEDRRGQNYVASPREVQMVNAALHLRRPLLVTGPPGCGKSSLAYAVAWKLGLGRVLHWAINSRSTLAEGLYRYDVVGRLQEVNLGRASGQPSAAEKPEEIGRFIRLGPLGTALASHQPRVLLIDELDKSDIDLPNDLLNALEEGEFEIPELARTATALGKDRGGKSGTIQVMPHDGREDSERLRLDRGRVCCREFPVVFMTSNEERELPPAFLRRCLRLKIDISTDKKRLSQILKSQIKGIDPSKDPIEYQLNRFLADLKNRELKATDQLLNAAYLVLKGKLPDEEEDRKAVLDAIHQRLDQP